MNENLCSFNKIREGLFVSQNGINAAILADDNEAVIFNYCGELTPEDLLPLGINRIKMIFCTQYRRSTSSGIYEFFKFEPQIIIPAKEAGLFSDVENYWNDPKNRWHIYDFMPDSEVLPRSVPRVVEANDGDAFGFNGFEVKTIDTPGATFGGVSYLFVIGGVRYCFCGDLIYGDGQINNLYALARSGEKYLGYHDFMAARKDLLESLKRISRECDVLVPARGPVIYDPRGACAKLEDKIEKIYSNYAFVSSLNYYFAEILSGSSVCGKMEPSEKLAIPDYIIPTGAPSFVVKSETGAAFLVDCGDEAVVALLGEMISNGKITRIEGCWVTHYHDDHVDALPKLVDEFGTEIICVRELADILQNPERYFLPCISPSAVSTTIAAERKKWKWREFEFTAMHFPGQSLYHGGLLVEGLGAKILFAGDSGAPTGLDDYCPQNRNFLGAGRGSRKVLELLREFEPDLIINQHQPEAFKFSGEQLEFMERTLAERERLYAEIFPHPSPDFGLDEHWLRSYPYESSAKAGDELIIQLHATNHAEYELEFSAKPVLPLEWETADEKRKTLTPRTCGFALPDFENPDAIIGFKLKIPQGAKRGKYIIPFSVSLGGTVLGQIKHAIVNVV